MRQRNLFASVATVVAMAVTASAVNDIHSFGGGVEGTDYDIADGAGEITIYNASGIAYAFWAEDDDDGPGTGFINAITLDDPESMTGNFTLLIADPDYPNDPDKPGALNWDAGVLTYAAGTATVINVHLAGDLAGGGDIACDAVAGTIKIGGDLASGGDFTCGDVSDDIYVAGNMASGGAVTLGDVTGDITVIGNMATGGDVTCGSVGGNIDVTGTLGAMGNDAYTLSASSVSGYIDLGGLWGNLDLGSATDITIGGVIGYTPGNITIGGAYGDTFTLNDAYSGTLTIEGDLTGVIDINGSVLGQVVIEGDIDASGRVALTVCHCS